MIKILYSLFLGGVVGGCAFSEVTIDPSQVDFSTSAPGNGREVSVVMPMEDNRDHETKYRCGTQKNGYNMETADVVCSSAPTKFLPEMLAAELRRSGFRVVSEAELGTDGFLVKSRLNHFFVEPKIDFWTFSPESDVYVSLIVKNRDGLLAERDFYIKGVEVSLTGISSNFQLASEKAVKQIIEEMVGALSELDKKYPIHKTYLFGGV